MCNLAGEKLRQLRGSLTQEEVASKIGVSFNAWSMYERGKRIPRDPVKVKIAAFFNKTVQEIFYD